MSPVTVAAEVAVNSASMKILRFGLEQAYTATLADAGLDVTGISEREIHFLNDAIVTDGFEVLTHYSDYRMSVLIVFCHSARFFIPSSSIQQPWTWEQIKDR